MFRRQHRQYNKDYEDYVDYEGSQGEPQEEWSSHLADDWETESNYYNENYHQEYPHEQSREDDYGELPPQSPSNDSFEPAFESRSLRREGAQESSAELKGQRSRYNARIDRFLNNGIIIVGVLLIIVLVIAFML